MSEAASRAGSQTGGLLDSLKVLGRSLLALAQTRLEILGSELEEQRAVLLREVLLSIMAAFCLGLGAMFTAAFFVILFWDSHRLLVVGFFAAAFFIASGVALVALRAIARERPRTFSVTTAELRKDSESLQ
jgi:uncharacterized membrane protein YqjE